MATISANWTENQELQAKAALAGTASATDDIDLADGGYDAALIQFEVVFGGSPDDDYVITILPSADSGTNDDTVAITTLTIAQATSTTKRASLLIEGLPYIAVKRTNEDSTDNVSETITYAVRNYTSA